jgi:hypothetical protein
VAVHRTGGPADHDRIDATAVPLAGVTGQHGDDRRDLDGNGRPDTDLDGDGRPDTDPVLAGGAGYGTPAPAMVDPDRPAASADGGLLPGAIPAEPAAMLFSPEAADDFRGRWREVQLRFVDDPKAAVGDAEHLVSDAINELAAALARQKDELGSWQSGGTEDTEQLRVAVRRYRDFLDRVLGR